MRLNQFIAESGMCSRREADRLIAAGEVTVNGAVAALGQQVSPGDRVSVSGRDIAPESERIFILVNKPLGVTSTTDRSDRNNIIDFVGHPKRLFTIGRLDRDSTGALLLTNDGNIVNRLLRSENELGKTYIVHTDKNITPDFLAKMAGGVKIYNPVTNSYVVTKPCEIRQVSAKSFEIILTQGYNRQIRRMCTALEYRVLSLNRTRFLFLSVEGLKAGAFRSLTPEEIKKLDEVTT